MSKVENGVVRARRAARRTACASKLRAAAACALLAVSARAWQSANPPLELWAQLDSSSTWVQVTGPTDPVLHPVQHGKLKVQGQSASSGSHVTVRSRVYCQQWQALQDEYEPEWDLWFLQAATAATLDTDLGLGSAYQYHPTWNVGADQFTLLRELCTEDEFGEPDDAEVTRTCRPLFRPSAMNLPAICEWKPNYLRWPTPLRSWWQPIMARPSTDARVLRFEALAKQVLLDQAGGAIDSTFFDEDVWKAAYGRGLVIEIQVFGIQGDHYAATPSDYWQSETEEDVENVPPRLLYDPFASLPTVSNTLTVSLAGTSGGPPSLYKPWPSFMGQFIASVVSTGRGEEAFFPIDGVIVATHANLKAPSGAIVEVEVRNGPPGFGAITIPSNAQLGVHRITKVWNDESTLNLLGNEQYPFSVTY